MSPEPRTILTIDIGNTMVKVSVFEGLRLIQSASGKVSSSRDLLEMVGSMLTYNSADGAVICSVGKEVEDLIEMLAAEYELPVVELGPSTPLPIEVHYGSRTTLGADRVAAAVGVSNSEFAVLVVDAGTAVTADLVADGCFLGGNISPGLLLRFRSLHDFTSRLPLVGPDGLLDTFGHDTESAIRAGVLGGLLAEVENDYRNAQLLYPDVRLILTGGDAALLAPLLEARGLRPEINAEAVGRGLVKVFNYNNN